VHLVAPPVAFEAATVGPGVDAFAVNVIVVKLAYVF